MKNRLGAADLTVPPGRHFIDVTVSWREGPAKFRAVDWFIVNLPSRVNPSTPGEIIHIVSHEESDGANALTSLPAFKAFSEGVKDRCELAPTRVELTEIGSYGFFAR